MSTKPEPFWFQYVLQNPNYAKHASYWLRGVERDLALGWLCWEVGQPSVERWQEPNRVEALQAWRDGAELPRGWHRLDRAAALRAYEEGVRLWGADWFEHDDIDKDSIVLQRALLGEVRYR